MEYWGIRTPPTSTNCVIGACVIGAAVATRLEPGVDGGGNVGATASVGGTTVGSGLGVSNMQAARLTAARKDAMRNFSFMPKRIT